ncbi:uncharacterized protein [Macrobrachium rosenbergii]|uniref:uncharacterized protein n=1 Tax=Macrobrachium rosenbergii TaxID=79674 RepID=UPI0034D4D98F
MDLKGEFDELLNQLKSIEEIKVPRSCFNEGTCSLHVFVDASQVAYGACAYVVSSKHTSHLLMSKSRVAPSPPLSIPRQELLALTIGMRLAVHLLEIFGDKISDCTVWSDSQVALSWVFYERSKEVFVVNRVKEIKSAHNIRLLYVTSEDNPADLVTRGISMSLLSKPGLWFHGPTWIVDRNQFPEQEDVVYRESVNVNENIVEPVLRKPDDDVLVFNCSEFSSLKHALRIVASKFLRDVSEEPEVRNYLMDHNLEWKFITPRSPWKGGFYERLIGVVKSCLQRALYRKRISFLELTTIVAEAENIINNRPLTYVNEDNADIALTPAKLLYGRTFTMAPPLNKFVDVPFNENVELRENYASLCETIRKFEKLWLLDYLSSLRERHRNIESSNICPLSTGDLVLIANDNCKRYKYPLGIIEKLHAGPDNVIRTVEIKTASGNFTRPLNQVIPLQCNVREKSSTESGRNEAGEARDLNRSPTTASDV